MPLASHRFYKHGCCGLLKKLCAHERFWTICVRLPVSYLRIYPLVSGLIKGINRVQKMPASRRCSCDLCSRFLILRTAKKNMHIEYLRNELQDKQRGFHCLLAKVGPSRISSFCASPCAGTYSAYAVLGSSNTIASLARLYKTLVFG